MPGLNVQITVDRALAAETWCRKSLRTLRRQRCPNTEHAVSLGKRYQVLTTDPVAFVFDDKIAVDANQAVVVEVKIAGGGAASQRQEVARRRNPCWRSPRSGVDEYVFDLAHHEVIGAVQVADGEGRRIVAAVDPVTRHLPVCGWWLRLRQIQ